MKHDAAALVITLLCATATSGLTALAQEQHPPQIVTSNPCHFDAHTSDVPGPACLLTRKELGTLPNEPIYWHLDTFPGEAEAKAASSAGSSIVTDYGKTWLFTIAGKSWRAKGGAHVADIGPLPLQPAKSFAAEYVHSFFAPGMTAPVHKHSGPEAFYTVEGDTCLEMPGDAHTGKGPGNSLIMPGGPPMLLMAVGPTPRRAFALILHDATLPPTTRVDDWKPEGRCRAVLSRAQGREE